MTVLRRMGLKRYQIYTTILITMLLLLTAVVIPGFQACASDTSASGSSTSRSRAYDFTFNFKKPETIIEPKSEGVVEALLDNKGSEDDFSLEFESIPTDWSAYFDAGSGKLTDKLSVHLGEGNDKYIFIYVKTPASGKLKLNVICKSVTTKNTVSSNITIEAKKVISFNLKDTNNVHTVKAGANTTFELEITNHLESTEEVMVSVEPNPNLKFQAVADDEKWCVSFDNTILTIASNKSKSLIVMVFAPNFGEPTDSITLFIIAELQSISQEFKAPKDLVVKIPEIYNITYSIKQETPLIIPNSTVNYTIKFFNVGNVDDTIRLELHENPQNWGIYFFYEEKLFTPIHDDVLIMVNDFVEFQAQVVVPLDAPSDKPYKIIYGIFSEGFGFSKNITRLEFVIKVKLISDIEIDVLTTGATLVDLEKVSYGEFEVQNMGNGEDTMYISIPQMFIPSGWDISFHSVKNTQDDHEINTTESVNFREPFKIDDQKATKYIPMTAGNYNNISLILASKQKAYVLLAITPPDTGKPVTETFKIYGEVVSDNIDTITKSMSVKLRVSNLIISEIKITPEKPEPNEKVDVIFNVTNNYHLPASDFTVKLIEINGVTDTITSIDSAQISNLAPGESQTMKFTWTAKDTNPIGYMLKASLSGDIIPADNNTPVRTQNVYVNPPSKKSDSENLNTLLIILAVLIIFVIVLVLMLLLTTKKKRVEEKELETKTKIKTQTEKQKKQEKRTQAKTSKSPPKRKSS